MATMMEGQAPIGSAPDATAITALARAAIDRLPPDRPGWSAMPVEVQEEPDDATMALLGLDHPLGVTVRRERTAMGAERLVLYRQAILAEWCVTGVRLDDLVARLVREEIVDRSQAPQG